ncbi:MAG: hypothetical protein H6709_19110 [Kofleriaceae bacterium]|nr:hypothetical protein [Myxococcales bacterium]MCB9561374.1 hypothetical protein [Kofleriaceae bacterium]MCB9574200.1 hypothetical protein [Kofleriaceae bacterium]
MTTRAYSICRQCAAVYPEARRCPVCHGDAEAAREVASAITSAVEASRVVARSPLRGTALVVTGVVFLSLLCGLGMLALTLI